MSTAARNSDKQDNCAACNNPDTDNNYVQCDACNSWWHFSCVNVSDSVRDRAWMCSNCMETAPQNPPEPRCSSSSSSDASMQRSLAQLKKRQDLERQRMEHELQVKFLNEQLALLDSTRSRVSNRESGRLVADWVNGNPEQEDGAVGGPSSPPAAAQPAEVNNADPVETVRNQRKQLQSCQLQSVSASQRIEYPTRQLQQCIDQRERGRDQSDWSISPLAVQRRYTLPNPPDDVQCTGSQQNSNLGAYKKRYANDTSGAGKSNVHESGLSNKMYGGNVPHKPSMISYDTIPIHNIRQQSVSRDFEQIPLDTHRQQCIPSTYYDQQRDPSARCANPNVQSAPCEEWYQPQQRRRWNADQNGPSPQQLAARQSLACDLPQFSGDPADWPIFISNYEYTTTSCGYTNGENMLRLQRCLKGPALETELVEKLPADQKLMWAGYKRKFGVADLKTFMRRAVEAATPAQQAESHTHQYIGSSVLFRIVPVTLHGQTGEVNTYAFLDEGSSLTLIENGIAEQLGVNGATQPLCLRWTGNTSRIEEKSKIVSLTVSGAGSQKRFKMSNVRTVSNLNLPSQSFQMEEAAKQFDHLKQLPIQSYRNAVPKLLIGLDNLHLAVPLKSREGTGNGPIAVKTRLGWCAYGKQQPGVNDEHSFHICECTTNKELHDAVKQFYEIEEIGSGNVTLRSKEEQCALDLLAQTTVRVGQKFETGLLWKDPDVELPDSYTMALRRLECLERKMLRDPSLKANVLQQMQDFVKKVYIHKATTDELKEADPRRIWYLPIGVVTNPKKPGKIRIVWDAAAKVSGVSLNSVLMKGPDQLVPLLGVLFRFRQFKVAVCSDVKEMFLQIRMRATDKHAQRILWRTDTVHDPEIFLVDVATFGSTCSPASAQFVKNQNAREHSDRFPRAADGILQSTYVDDYLDSFGSEEEACRISEEVRQIFRNGGFQLRNWISNSESVLQHLGETQAAVSKSLTTTSNDAERVVGMLWDPLTDELSFSTRMSDEVHYLLENDKVPTKRQVLHCVMTLFDPLGLLATFLIHGKILIQDLWRAGLEWNAEVSNSQYADWRRWTKMLSYIANVRIPRCYFSEASTRTYEDTELRVFVDASLLAYSCALYLRTIDESSSPQCVLIAAKAKVAPLKPMTIPKLELQGCVLGVRMMNRRMEVGAIGVKPKVGPKFLSLPEREWPSPADIVVDTVEEGRPLVLFHANWIPVIDYYRFSKWERLQRSMAFVLRFISNTRKKGEKSSGQLTQQELYAADIVVLMQVQMEAFVDEVATLRNNKTLPEDQQESVERTSTIYQLMPMMDEQGLVRQNSRLAAAKHLPHSVRFPVILPRKHRYTELLAARYHRLYRHANFETVVNEIRQLFVVPRLRSVVKAVERNCQLCKVRKALPTVPPMAPLPFARLAVHDRAFSYVGVDYFGPLLVKQGRSNVKRWIALFTCLTVRAVHLEVAYSLSTSSCISCIRRFVCRRGAPREFFSDNATNFHGAERLLRKQINEGISATFTNANTKWTFIPPSAPNMGGAWERLVRSVKTAIGDAYAEEKLNDEDLQTLIVEAEGIVNTRPLTYLPLDSAESASLTPNHFLMGSSNGVKQPTVDTEPQQAASLESWHHIHRQLNRFWQRWLKEFLPVIRKQSKWFGEFRPLKDGDLVLIVDEGKRNGWMRGTVIEAIKASDGHVRQAIVQTAGGVFHRPVSKLAVLDVNGNSEVIGARGPHPGEDVATGTSSEPATRL
ncbi:uncharacterized protein LOC128746327 [Sabethes cyaneus]|uniref:uncharacterized protein LOC128746327 n=1 Tax=Sabethes cyaneus TaxID=53552 RepID=UPI00237E0996|nr:uncharacterized protein LOC128746327 [Sabethes cyaneus]